MATGVLFMDEEHKQLLDSLAALDEAFDARDADAIGRRFTEMLNGVAQHFADEERAMQNVGGMDAAFAEHKREHDDFLMQLRFFQSRLGKSGTSLAMDIPEFVSTWTVAHVLGQDRKLGQALAGQTTMAMARAA